LRIGIVGTGFVAKLRAELFSQDARVQLKAIAGNPLKAGEIAQTFGMEVHEYWSELVIRSDIDLVVVATINRDHSTVVSQALRCGKHVIVEYPLSFNLSEAEELVQLAQQKQLMLHVEHIELLGGVHQAAVESLSKIGAPFYARYATQNPQRPAPDKWTYMPDLFGFPLVAAVSRIHRLTAMFGMVKSVSCQLRYAGLSLPKQFTSCVCNAQLQFSNGLIADVGYSKGESVWKPERSLEIQGSSGAIIYEAEVGKLITTDGEETLPAGPSRGLFKKDTENVLAHLFTGAPLYVTPASALHALAVACAAEKSARTNQVVSI
jgi:biliverdin reductase